MSKTLNEIYAEGLEHNVDIFSSMVIPANTAIITKHLRDTILKNAGDLLPLWDSYLLLKAQIELWSRSNSFIFEHVDKILKAEYSPIENTDKYVEHTETNVGGDTTTKNLTTRDGGTDSITGTDTDTRTLNTTERNSKGTTTTATNSGTDRVTTNNTSENAISGFNSGSYQPESKKTDNGTENTTHGHVLTETNSGADSTTNTGTITDSHAKGTTSTKDMTTTETGTVTNENNNTLTIIDHTHGNIGVTTNTTLINEEIALIKNFSAYDLISEVFINDLCIGVFNHD